MEGLNKEPQQRQCSQASLLSWRRGLSPEDCHACPAEVKATCGKQQRATQARIEKVVQPSSVPFWVRS